MFTVNCPRVLNAFSIPSAFCRLYGTMLSVVPWKSMRLTGLAGKSPKPSSGVPDTGPILAKIPLNMCIIVQGLPKIIKVKVLKLRKVRRARIGSVIFFIITNFILIFFILILFILIFFILIFFILIFFILIFFIRYILYTVYSLYSHFLY